MKKPHSRKPSDRIEHIYVLFGAKVKYIREAIGLTQQELASVIGLERTSVVNIEAGRQRILLHDVDMFARALNVTTKHLMKGIWT